MKSEKKRNTPEIISRTKPGKNKRLIRIDAFPNDDILAVLGRLRCLLKICRAAQCHVIRKRSKTRKLISRAFGRGGRKPNSHKSRHKANPENRLRE